MLGGSRNKAQKSIQTSATPEGNAKPIFENQQSKTPFTSQITTHYGPTNLLGRFFLDS